MRNETQIAPFLGAGAQLRRVARRRDGRPGRALRGARDDAGPDHRLHRAPHDRGPHHRPETTRRAFSARVFLLLTTRAYLLQKRIFIEGNNSRRRRRVCTAVRGSVIVSEDALFSSFYVEFRWVLRLVQKGESRRGRRRVFWKAIGQSAESALGFWKSPSEGWKNGRVRSRERTHKSL